MEEAVGQRELDERRRRERLREIDCGIPLRQQVAQQVIDEAEITHYDTVQGIAIGRHITHDECAVRRVGDRFQGYADDRSHPDRKVHSEDVVEADLEFRRSALDRVTAQHYVLCARIGLNYERLFTIREQRNRSVPAHQIAEALPEILRDRLQGIAIARTVVQIAYDYARAG